MSLEDRARRAYRPQPPPPSSLDKHDARSWVLSQIANVERDARCVLTAWCGRMEIDSVPPISIVLDESEHACDPDSIERCWRGDYYFAYGYFEIEGRHYQLTLGLDGPAMSVAMRPPHPSDLLPNWAVGVRVSISHKAPESRWRPATTLEELGAALKLEADST